MTDLLGADYGQAEPGVCLPFDAVTDNCPDWDDLDEDVRVRALSLAWSTIRGLTGGRVGSCPVVMRPCFETKPCGSCWGASFQESGALFLDPHRREQGRCSCCNVCEITMPGQVAAITEVDIDGWKLDTQLFRIDNGNILVRQDGYCWPSCQNMGLPSGAIGTVTIRYLPGILPTAGGLVAAGVLACEYAKAVTGAKGCRLPSSVTSVVRQGVAMEMSASMFENGTGIREVDGYIESVNPNGLKTPPKVWSPDAPGSHHRITTSQVRK